MVAKRLFLVLLCLAVLAAPAFGASKDIIYASESTPKSLDPHDTTDTYSGAIEKAMLEGLMGFDKDLKVIPLLAESYTFNSTATEFTFKLRKGIKFHDGTPFNAEAVRVNIARLMGGKLKRSSLMKPVKELVVVDESTVKFVLNEPFGAFINTVAHPGALILSPAALAKYGDEVSKNPVGTGPFIFGGVGFRHGEDQEEPRLLEGRGEGRLHHLPPGSGKRLPAGHAARRPGPVHLPHAGRAAQGGPGRPQDRDHRTALHRRALPGLEHPLCAACRPARAPGHQLRPGQAGHHPHRLGRGRHEADSIIPPNLQFYKKQSTWPYDLAKAKALMKEAGYENGFKVVFLTPNPSNRLRATEMVQQQLKEINITGEIQSMDVASFYNKLEAHRADDPNQVPFIAFGGWSSSTGDADWGIRPLLATAALPARPFQLRVSSPTRKWMS